MIMIENENVRDTVDEINNEIVSGEETLGGCDSISPGGADDLALVPPDGVVEGPRERDVCRVRADSARDVSALAQRDAAQHGRHAAPRPVCGGSLCPVIPFNVMNSLLNHPVLH